jgi:putative aldouronate transport system permease protein
MENKKLSQRTGKRRISAFTVINTIVLILVAFTMLYPFWYVLMGSFMSSSESVTSVFHFFVKKPTLEAYRSFFSSHNVGRHFLASAYASVFGMVVSLLCTSMAAYALSRKSLPGKNFVMKLVLGAMLFSGGMIPIYMVVRQLKMINTWESLYIPGIINLYYLIIMRTYFRGIPEDLLDAARIDGAGEFNIFVRIVLPTALPILATIALFYMVDRWNDLMSGIIYINDVNDQPLQAMLYRIINNQAGSGNSPVSSVGSTTQVTTETAGYAATIITMLPIMCVYPFLQKYFIHGMLVGSTKD